MDQNDHDLEGDMAKNQLFNIAKYALVRKVMKMIKNLKLGFNLR